jgi:hypothetical protein
LRGWTQVPGSEPVSSGSLPAVLVGLGVSFVAGVDLVRALRPGVLLDSDPTWAVPRLLLGLLVVATSAAAGGAASALFLSWSRSAFGAAEPAALPFRLSILRWGAVGAVLTGAAVRIAFFSRLAFPFLIDEVNLISPALALSGTWRDMANSIRPIPYGVTNPHEMIGVVYLEALRVSLSLFGTTATALRALSILGGVASLVTATLLARALLPAGGAMLAALALAGLRWHLILSVSGWHSILIAPLCDVAALFLLRARRGRRVSTPAFAAGLTLGLGAHVYLAAWIAAAALLGFALWPQDRTEGRAPRVRRAAGYLAGFLLAVSPLFLLHSGREIPYFGRASRHNVFREMRYTASATPVFAAAADALVSPWFLAEPEGRHDLPNRSRLGWILGIPVAFALSRALARPRNDLSGLLLSHAAAGFAAAVLGGQAGLPNGFRFGYLTTVTAVAAAAGIGQLLGMVPPAARRAAALAFLGLLAINGVVGIRDAFLRWPEHRVTFDRFFGQDTLLGLAAARWERYGSVMVERGIGQSDLTIDTVRRYRLEVGRFEPGDYVLASRRFRLARSGTEPAPGERIVERVRDDWGREWGVLISLGGEP